MEANNKINITAKTARLLTWLVWLSGGLLIMLAVAWLAYVELGSEVDWLGAQPGQVIIEWTTASEISTAGFNLYRAADPKGTYEQVNDDLIPSSLDPMLGGRYAYTDTGVISGQTYYYRLEDVEYSGSVTPHGPLEARARPLYTPMVLPAWWALLAAGGILLLASFGLDRYLARRYVQASSDEEDVSDE